MFEEEHKGKLNFRINLHKLSEISQFGRNSIVCNLVINFPFAKLKGEDGFNNALTTTRHKRWHWMTDGRSYHMSLMPPPMKAFTQVQECCRNLHTLTELIKFKSLIETVNLL